MPYRNMVSLRLDDRDLDALEAASERSGLSRSELLRALLRVPPGADRQRTVYAVDGRTLGRMATELVRWGRHYNQAVHALNTIALLVRRGSPPKPPELEAMLGRALSALEEVEAGRRVLEAALTEVADSIAVRRD